MFKAIDTHKQQPVIILDPRWRDRIGELRSASQRGELVCQECRRPVQVRAGDVRRWHFAHRKREGCPIDSEDPDLLNARAVLYAWLVGKFGADAVAIEERIPGLPRPIDCWVRRDPRPFGYWVVERTLGASARQLLLTTCAQHEVIMHWVLLAALLRPDLSVSGQVTLSTTERDLLVATPYDAPASSRRGPSGRSLHYLDAQRQTLTTWRGLSAWHPPAGYEGVERASALADLLVSPRTGEFVHPGEAEARRAYEAQLRAEEEGRRLAEEQRQAWEPPQPAAPAPPLLPLQLDAGRPVDGDDLQLGAAAVRQGYQFLDVLRQRMDAAAGVRSEEEAPPAYRCTICGQVTTDYWTYQRQAGTCECRTCLRSGRCG